MFDEGIVLDIPPGALESEVFIDAHWIAPTSPQPGLATLESIELSPSGLDFALPATLSVKAPEQRPGAPYDADDLVALTTEPDGDGAIGELRFSISDDGNLSASLHHFSTLSLMLILSDQFLVDAIGSCTTAPLRKLSRQIRQRLVDEGRLVEVSHPQLLGMEGVEVYLEPETAAALVNVLDASVLPGKLLINSAWRSFPDQVLLDACGNSNVTAKPNRSKHLTGRAIDVQGATTSGSMQTRCTNLANQLGNDAEAVLSALHPVWGEALLASGFEWYGLGASLCGDPPHFEYVDSATDFRAANIAAFQSLWNDNNPCDKIPEAELTLAAAGDAAALTQANIPVTYADALLAPLRGFDSTTPLVPMELGTPGLGCQSDKCCPGYQGIGQYCATECECFCPDATPCGLYRDCLLDYHVNAPECGTLACWPGPCPGGLWPNEGVIACCTADTSLAAHDEYDAYQQCEAMTP